MRIAENSDTQPALIRRFHDGKLRGDESVKVYGAGTPRREFLQVDYLADAVLHLLQTYDAESIVNIGWRNDVTMRELAELVLSVIGYRGRLDFDLTKPDGTARKLLEVPPSDSTPLAAENTSQTRYRAHVRMVQGTFCRCATLKDS